MCVLRLVIEGRSGLHIEYGMPNTCGHEYKFPTIKARPSLHLSSLHEPSHTHKNGISDCISVKALPLRDTECEMESPRTLKSIAWWPHNAVLSVCALMPCDASGGWQCHDNGQPTHHFVRFCDSWADVFSKRTHFTEMNPSTVIVIVKREALMILPVQIKGTSKTLSKSSASGA